MPKIPFNVDAYTARLIGRENVSKLNGAILELVKNTYDADASVCFVYFDEIRQEVYIGDNGCGMTPEIIRTNWMTKELSNFRSTIKYCARIAKWMNFRQNC